jgi:hypothetical protein
MTSSARPVTGGFVGAENGTFNRALHFGQVSVLLAATSGALTLAPQEQATEMDMGGPPKNRRYEEDGFGTLPELISRDAT